MPPKSIGGLEEIEDCKQIATLVCRVCRVIRESAFARYHLLSYKDISIFKKNLCMHWYYLHTEVE